MGKWHLESISGRTTTLNSDTFGHNVYVDFVLRYSASHFGKFEEVPLLEWNEQIYMLEHHNNNWWEFSANMYKHNPLSKTLEIWAKRYIVAYDTAAGRGSITKGSCKLCDKNRSPVPGSKLPKAATDQQKADAVRNYLKAHGGYLLIQVHDIPSINKPTDRNTRKERLLVFDCGVTGSGSRFKGVQHLDVNGAALPFGWRQDFVVGDPSATVARFIQATQGKPKVPPPGLVANPRQPLFAAGECW